jgi:phosphoenolpyruvate-protein phosphotransferase (PTS system enzyme I)
VFTLYGIPASPGHAVARIHRIVKEELRIRRRDLEAEEIPAEIDAFRASVDDAKRDISALVERLAGELGSDEVAILESQLLILEDELLVDRSEQRIRDDRVSAEGALHDTMGDLIRQFDSLDDDYFRERVLDLRDVEERLLRRLQGIDDAPLDLPDEPHVIVASDLTPSETAAISRSGVLAFVLGAGSKTSHVAILARSLGVPAVVGLGDKLAELNDARMVAVDGESGVVVVDPDSATVARVRQLSQKQTTVNAKLAHLRDVPAETPDGRRLGMLTNIEMPVEVEMARAAGAEGVGLLRTEYIFFQHQTIPTEDEQLAIYREFIDGMDGRPIVFRTLDVGGDKVQRYLGARKESNPFLGWRGIRYLLANKPMLKVQLRAMYRAAVHGPIRLMFPMITGVEELREARAICRESCDELAAEGVEHDPEVPVGIMIETPSAAAVADLLARECDFFSIGTNDLIQYTLAMDRLNSRVAYLYQPLHPAILRLIKRVVEMAHGEGVPVGICGEMASETKYAEVLMGLGLDDLSVHAAQLPKIKQVVRWTPMPEAENLLADLMNCATAEEAVRFHEDYLANKKRRRNDGTNS